MVRSWNIKRTIRTCRSKSEETQPDRLRGHLLRSTRSITHARSSHVVAALEPTPGSVPEIPGVAPANHRRTDGVSTLGFRRPNNGGLNRVHSSIVDTAGRRCRYTRSLQPVSRQSRCRPRQTTRSAPHLTGDTAACPTGARSVASRDQRPRRHRAFPPDPARDRSTVSNNDVALSACSTSVLCVLAV